MKKIFIFAAAAAMLASCSQDVLTDINSVSNDEGAISFGTWTSKATRAENSTGADGAQLEKYHNTFVVYGFKNVYGKDEAKVFDGTVCTYTGSPSDPFYVESSAGDWKYSPVRYWDKSADGYDFYAVSPCTETFTAAGKTGGFVLAGIPGNYYFTLSGYSVDGKSLAPNTEVTGQHNDCFATTNVNAADPMIATDVKGYHNFSKEHVQLDFNHILSRLNLAVKTNIPALGATVTLKKLMVYNMQSKGDFKEKNIDGTTNPATVTPFANLDKGTAARWTTGYGETQPFGYDGTTANYITGGTSGGYVLTTAYNYVYQTLVIPQVIATESINLNGKDLTPATAKPYLYIEYEIAYQGANGETETNFAYYNLASLFQNGYVLDAEGRAGYQTEGEGVYVYSDDMTKFYTEAGDGPVNIVYNKGGVYYSDAACETEEDDDAKIANSFKVLVDANGPIRATRGNADVTFCEGWQNNLLITIDPTAILFDASVFKWVTKENVEVTIQ